VCRWCKEGLFSFCPSLFGNSTAYGLPGAFAEFIKIPNAVPGISFLNIPDEIDDISAATLEPVSVAVATVKACEPKPADKVVVLGGGIIGNTMMQVFRGVPVAKVVVTEVSEKRLKLARELGAHAVIHAAEEDVMSRLKEEVGVGRYHFGEGTMADIVVETAGVPETVEACFDIVRSCGVIAFVGLAEKKAALDVTRIVHKSPRIIGCLTGDMHGAIEAVQTRKVDTKPLITHTCPLEKVKEAFEMQLSGDAMKVMIQF
jgi:threonine dehydrogenase-like Zn-dependent dehydrogenase